jgi:ABC-type branched-subunit amino acid transport system permease subunit
VSMSIYFLLLGLGSGGVYTLLATGLMLKYRSSSVVDFGHGAVAMYVAYVYLNLHADGQFELPWVILPHQFALTGEPLGTVASLLIALAYSAVLGALLYVLVYRPLRTASQLVRVCASVGTMLYLQAVAVLNFGTTTQSTGPILPNGSVRLPHLLPVPAQYFWLAGLSILLTVASWAAYRFTRFGLATRAAADNELGASVIGLSTDRLAGGNWVIASVLAGFAGVMIAPLSTVNPTSYTLFIVPALGVCLLARFRSFAVAGVVGFGLAMLQTLGEGKLPALFPSSTSLSQGLPPALPFIAVIGAMVFISRGVGARGEETTQRNPSLGLPQRPYLTTLLAFGLGLVALVVLHELWAAQFMYSLGMVCIALSLVVLTGYVGQVSLAQMSFAGLSALLLTHFTAGVGIGFPFSILISSLAAVPLGLVVGLPALRLRGVNLAIITLATAYLADDVLTNWKGFAGGLAGRRVPQPTLLGLHLGIQYDGHYPRFAFGVLSLAIVCLVGLLVARLRRSPAGRTMLAIRSNERAAAAAGIDTARIKLFAFGLSAWIAGLGGCLLAYQGQTTSASPWSTFNSLSLLAIVMVAGLGRISGAVVAGVLLSANGLMVTFLSEKLSIGQYQLVVAGLALTLTAIGNPNGIAANPPPPLVWGARRLGRIVGGAWSPAAPSQVPVK